MADRATSPRPTRVPPNNLRAEESVLGAMLLSREAIAEVVETLDPDHFYKPAHGHLYDAIMGLYGAGQPVDAVTVAEELARAGLLDEIGGPSLLLDLQASTPAISNAAHYAKIVEEHALLRRLIMVSNEIAETAYGVPDDVVKAIDDAESRMFEVAQRRVTNTTAEIKDLLSANLDRLEQLYERGDAITGSSTGYIDLDEMLAGLQPNALYVIGARPAMGKALALDTPIPTPDGWSTMGQLGVGDRVFDNQGEPTVVTYKSPVFRGHDCFEVCFDDGSSIVADAEHQWLTWDKLGTNPSVRTTASIAASVRVRSGEGDRPNHRIPVAEPLQLSDLDLPIDPYVLGCWLADGHPAGPTIIPTESEIEQFHKTLQEIGCWKQEKHIPPMYLRASAKQRLSLLQGLMDTDGCVVRGQVTCQLALSNERLLLDARELVLSLGYKVGSVRIKRTAVGTDVRFINFSAPEHVFRIQGKRSAQKVVDRPNSRCRWRTIVAVNPVASVPTQCITVDSPSHLYLAGREMIPTHNTAFGLGMAANAAMKDQKPVLIFSLEMSQLELSQRILCSEALVDSSRVRTGKIGEAEWTRISHAVGRLAESPIFIDDNPHTSVMEIRAKARRLKSRVGDLGMVIVDYIQLMSGRSNAESRQVEVSEISRGLKILARELEAPVVALAQLNRSLEQRVDKRPMLSDLRESGCLPASTRVMRADSGRETTIGELVLSQEQPLVWSMDERQRLVPRRMTKVFPTGIKPVYRMTLASGRRIDATANHPFYTIGGWRRLDELDLGEYLATPRVVAEPAEVTEQLWSDDELGLLAHLIGDGSIGPNSVKYATGDPANESYVAETAKRLFGIETKTRLNGKTSQMCLPSPYRLTDGRFHPVRNWLEPHGLWGSRSWNKFVPESIFSLGNVKLAHFLHHLWATDGSLTIGRNGRGPTVRCYYATTSHRLALDVQRLLQRLGVRSSIGTSRKRREGGEYRPGYSVCIQGAANQTRFLTAAGCHGQRGAFIPQALEILEGIKENPNVDVATSDIYWDEILSIELVGDQPTFDATVPGTHNFIADGIVVHNSLEQDADVVMFLYRDEVYDDQSPDKGVAEVIVAKHRNGPVGKVRLAFRGQYTRFDNMARSIPGSVPPPSDDGMGGGDPGPDF